MMVRMYVYGVARVRCCAPRTCAARLIVCALQTTRKSRSGVTDGRAKAGTVAAQAAAALKKMKERRAKSRRLAEIVADEAGVMAQSVDATTGVVDLYAALDAVAPLVSEALPAHAPAALLYLRAGAAAPVYPASRLCSVCGMRSAYTCARCGARFCCVRCNEQHKETRCATAGR
ncbi:hypothetical protein EON68_01890 [archaeon]|nr:MAG: hypothetical protein EON68_01890 [archaeon]